MNIDIPEGAVLIIQGKRGSGKTSLAREIAKPYGSVALADRRFWHRGLDLQPLLIRSPGVVIFDEVDNLDITLSLLELAQKEELEFSPPFQPAQVCPTPKFIVCTELDADERFSDTRGVGIIQMVADRSGSRKGVVLYEFD